MDLSGPGFTVHGWWVGMVLGAAALIVAAGNWRRRWYLPIIPRLRGIDPSFIASGQAGMGLAAFVFAVAEIVPDANSWHVVLSVVGYVCFVVVGLGSWAYGARFAPDPDSRA